MSKRGTQSDPDANEQEPAWSRLKIAAIKIRGLAYLIEGHRGDDQPLDVEDLYRGVGLIFSELGEEIDAIGNEIEEFEIKSASKSRGQR